MMLDVLLKAVTPVIEHIFPDRKQQDEAKLKLLALVESGSIAELKEQSAIIQQEAKGESWLQRNWRPITMLTFTGLVVAHWLGWTAPNLSEGQVLSLLDIVKVGLGGYVVGRSAEKIAGTWQKRKL